jgi:adenylyltransferase/sulfurtransferase
VPSDIHPLEITCSELQARRAEVWLLDCREPDEYAVARIEGSTLIPMSQLVERVGELAAQRDREIVVYCHHGGRSLRVTHWLRGQGFVRVSSLSGGIDAWSQQIDPAVPRY